MKKREETKSGGGFFAVIFLVLNVIIGVFSVIVSVTGFSTGNTLFGFLYLALGIFCFLPKKLIKIPNWLKFVLAVVISITLLIISIILNWNISPTPVVVSYNLNEEFIIESKVVNVSSIVYNVTKKQVISLNGEETTTEGYFLVVDYGFTNLGVGTITFNPTHYIMDNENKTYVGIAFTGSGEYFQPNLKKQAYSVFELPNSADGLKLYFKDISKTIVIDLEI
jgi:hypothetical protein